MSRSGGKQPTKTMPCRVCGKPMTVNVQKLNPPRCGDCALVAMAEAIAQMAARSGPAWDKWRKSNGRYGRGGGRVSLLT